MTTATAADKQLASRPMSKRRLWRLTHDTNFALCCLTMCEGGYQLSVESATGVIAAERHATVDDALRRSIVMREELTREGWRSRTANAVVSQAPQD